MSRDDGISEWGGGVLRIEAEFCGTRVPVWRRKWKRVVEFAGGPVGKLCPLVIRFHGAKRRAQRMQDQLKRYGYKVRIQRERSSEPVAAS